MAYQKLQANLAKVVVPSDTSYITSPGGADQNGCVLYIGVTGDLKVTTAANDDIVFKNVPVGFFPVQVLKVWATDTGASEIIALW